MNLTKQDSTMTGPGFVAAILDIPFPLALPNGAYLCHDPKKRIAIVQTLLKGRLPRVLPRHANPGPDFIRALEGGVQGI